MKMVKISASIMFFTKTALCQEVNFMCCLQYVHKMWGGHAFPYVFFISEATRLVLIKFGVQDLYLMLSGEIN